MITLVVVTALFVLILVALGLAEAHSTRTTAHASGPHGDDWLATLATVAIGLVSLAFRVLRALIRLAIPGITGLLDGPRLPDARGRLTMNPGSRTCPSCRGRAARPCAQCRGRGCPSCAATGTEICTRCGGAGTIRA
jgi:hypothetical protein